MRRLFPEAPLSILGDKSQLKQLFLNIFLNAIQAMPDGGELTVEALRKDGPKAVGHRRRHGRGHPRGEPGPHLRPVLHDQEGRHGAGPVDLLQYRQVPRGDIEVKSRPGQGTTILISLPLD